MITLDYALDSVMLLSPEQREMLIEVIRKQQIENLRKDIAEDAQEAISAFHAGKLKPKTADEIIAELRTDYAPSQLESPDTPSVYKGKPLSLDDMERSVSTETGKQK